MVISKDTLIPLGLVISLAVAFGSVGVTYSKVGQVVESSRMQAESLQQTRETLAALKSQNELQNRVFTDTLKDLKSDINDIRASQLRNSN